MIKKLKKKKRKRKKEEKKDDKKQKKLGLQESDKSKIQNKPNTTNDNNVAKTNVPSSAPKNPPKVAAGWTKGKLTEAQLSGETPPAGFEETEEGNPDAMQEEEPQEELEERDEERLDLIDDDPEVELLLREIEKKSINKDKERHREKQKEVDDDDLLEQITRERQRALDDSEDVNPLLLQLENENEQDLTAMSNAEIEALIDELEAGGYSSDMLGVMGHLPKKQSNEASSDIIARLEKQFKDIVGGDIHDIDKATDDGDSFIAGLLSGASGGSNEFDVVETYYPEDSGSTRLEDDESRAAELEARLARIEEMLKLTEGLDDL